MTISIKEWVSQELKSYQNYGFSTIDGTRLDDFIKERNNGRAFPPNGLQYKADDLKDCVNACKDFISNNPNSTFSNVLKDYLNKNGLL